MKPLPVFVVGLIPDLYRLCPTRCDWAAAAGMTAAGEQWRDYPPAARVAGDGAAVLVRRLLDEFAGRVRPVTVGLLSPRGLWLSWRHRLRGDRVYVVAGNRAVPADAGWEAVRQAVEQAWARHRAARLPAA